MKKIQPKRLTWAEIGKYADNFRKLYCNPIDVLPVPIEKVIEFKLKIDIVPVFGLRERAGIESYIQKDLKTIGIDSQIYGDERYSKRYRFTLAHEIGHRVLHSDIIGSIDFKNEDEWIEFYSNNNDEDVEWFERQAHQFAGCLLVPREHLLKYVSDLKNNIKESANKVQQIEDKFDYISTAVSKKICDNFAVSHEVVKHRIKTDHIFAELDLDQYFR